ncbi:MAG: PPOX class F420-dependent oxidoreductase [Proteobacteria bacterium]|nr:PPOX class F420-dependent oxidoreductase [Pseudomonadota bacterium]
MSSDALRSLQGERYISLETYKRDGNGVRTPVWFAPMGDSLVVVTNGNSYKVKRLKRNSTIKVAACNMTGKKLRSSFYEGTGEIISDPQTQKEALGLLDKKYGWQMKLTALLGRLSRRRRDWTVLRLNV